MTAMADLATQILGRARAQGLRIATAESCTGGLIAGALTEIAGSSDVFDCGIVTYSNAAKIRLLGVSPDTLKTTGAVSEETAAEMAAGVLASSCVDLAVSVTGIAGPGGSEHKPEGRVCFALAVKGRPVHSHTQEFGAIGRENVRHASVLYALDLLLSALKPV